MSQITTYPKFPMNHVQVSNKNALFGHRTYQINHQTISDFHYGLDLMGKDQGVEDLYAPADGHWFNIVLESVN